MVMVAKERNEDGFTLLELIVAMTIGVVLIAAIGQTIVYQGSSTIKLAIQHSLAHSQRTASRH